MVTLCALLQVHFASVAVEGGVAQSAGLPQFVVFVFGKICNEPLPQLCGQHHGIDVLEALSACLGGEGSLHEVAHQFAGEWW